MKKVLAVLLLVATVIGMTVPAMANPENEPIAVAKNVKDIFVEVDGSNVANGNIDQTLINNGDQNNWAQGIAIGGNAQSAAGNIGAAASGALAADGGSSEAEAFDNTASNTQTASSSASAGNPRGFGDDVDQDNTLGQYATAWIVFDLDLDQDVNINDNQVATANAPGNQNITDSVIEEDGWTKNVYKYIDFPVVE